MGNPLTACYPPPRIMMVSTRGAARAAAIGMALALSAGCTFDPLGATAFQDAGVASEPDAGRIPLDAGAPADAGRRDAAPLDTGTELDASAPDTGLHPDASAPDTGAPDSGAPDTGAPDTGVHPDAEVPDTGVPPDAGTPDSGGPLDAGSPDTGVAPDAGFPDSGVLPDSGFPYPVSNVTPPALGIASTANISNGLCTIDTGALSRSSGCPVDGTLSHATQPLGGPVAIWTVGALFVGSSGGLEVTGDRPLVVIAYDDVTIEGFVDVSAQGASPGAGGGTCSAGNGGVGNDATGGGGGGFGQPGAPGGAHDSNTTPPGSGGAVSGNVTLVPLRGGCSGGPGDGITRADGGGGGGALQISAADTLRVTGFIYVVGGGGRATATSGGGGGGSGGAVLLEAAHLELSSGSGVMLGGGGGGEGRGGLPNPGADGTFANTAPAPGGSGGGAGGDGGDGGTRVVLPQVGLDGAAVSAGGGGGGGAGRLRLNASTCALGNSPSPIVSGVVTSDLGGCIPP